MKGGQRLGPRIPVPKEGGLQLSLESWLSQSGGCCGLSRERRKGGELYWGSCLAILGCVQLAPGR